MDSSTDASLPLRPPRVLAVEEGKDYLLEPEDELPYRLIRSLGHGHSGNVEEVEDTVTGAVFARKTIRIYGPRDKDGRRRVFDNEINIIRNLASHHHIIRIFATYIGKREVGLILQPVADEGDLDAFLDRFREDMEESETSGVRQVDQAKVATLKRAFGCLAGGLAFMHKQRIRHKDIKPRNILIHRGSVVYTDFGYSLDSSQTLHSTTAGQPDFLTRRYSAPEVLDYGSRNSKSDVFSLGCVFIEILSALDQSLEVDPGQCFNDAMDDIHRQLSESGSNALKGFRADLSGVCALMTAREPADRCTASQVVLKLLRNSGYFCNGCQQTDYTRFPTEYHQRQLQSDPEQARAIGFDVGNLSTILSPPAGSYPVSADTHLSSVASESYATQLHTTTSESPSLTRKEVIKAEINDASQMASGASETAVPDNQVAVIGSFVWTWSAPHQDFYYVTRDGQGGYTYHWYKDTQVYGKGSTSSSLETLRPRGCFSTDSSQTAESSQSLRPHMPKGVSPYIRQQLPDLIVGTPERGWYEKLDSNYRMRTGGEVRQFFETGKVFATLHVQAASEELVRDDHDVVKYGERAFAQMRRFVIVQVRTGFVYACPITTYSGRGTLKPGINPSEHSIVYAVGSEPSLFHGESLTKEPIAIQLAEPWSSIDRASRVRFGKAYPVEMNVKVRDIGNVIPDDLSKLIAYYREEQWT